MNILKNKEYLRSIMFGVEDSLVSTTGLVAGISIGTNNKSFVLLAGLVAIAIEALSMGAGEYLSDDVGDNRRWFHPQQANHLLSGVLMFTSYFLAGFIPLFPILFLDYPNSLIVSVLLALLSLFLLGFVKGKIIKKTPVRNGLKIFLVGGAATMLGLIVGMVFKT